MSHTAVAYVVSPGITYTVRDGTPYRADESGIIHVASTHSTEFAALAAPKNQHGDTVGNAPSLAANSDLKGTKHQGAALTITVENG